MGGLVMPSAIGVLDKAGASHQVGVAAGSGNHQGYQLLGGPPDVVVDDRDVELGLGGELLPRGREPPLALLLRLGATADEPPDELLPRGRAEEDEAGARQRLPDLAGTLQVDL